MIYFHHCVAVWPGAVHQLFYFVDELIVTELEIGRDNRIKNKVGVACAGDHAKIVYAYYRIDLAHKLRNSTLHLGDLAVVSFDGVHMYCGNSAETLLDFSLGIINGIMDNKNIIAAVDLSVEGNHKSAGAVIMDDQIVNTYDLGIA